jgi:hypothetical protein
VLAYSYPLLGAFWTLLWFFLWVIWIFILFRVIIDIFRSHDLGGWGKAAWLIFVIILPFLGVFIYLIARGKEMGQRDVADAQARNAQFQAYVQQAAASQSPNAAADELAKLADLRDQGVISQAEFDQQKAKILG